MFRTALVTLLVCALAGVACDKAEDSPTTGSDQASEQAPDRDDEAAKAEKSARDDGPFSNVGALALAETEMNAPVEDVDVSAADGVLFVALKESPGVAAVRIEGKDWSIESAGSGIEVDGATEVLPFDGGEKLMLVNQWEKSSAHVFDVDPDTGALSAGETRKAPVKFANAVSPDGQFFYSVTPRENELTIAKLAGDTYKEVETIELGLTAPNESGSSQFLEVSPDGKHLYATTNRKYNEEREMLAEYRLYVYARDAKTGKLEEIEFHEHVDDELVIEQPKTLAVSPDGSYVAVGSSKTVTGLVSLFERDASTGKLTYVTNGKLQGTGALEGQILSPDGLAFSKDSSTLYAAFADIPAVGVFEIDTR